ncbi:hypothetical protein [Enterobacter bugandensis]|uniref:hypothetical protein n=1 Tax=Enterobacter bugandensis TaxID=881260 RepID=UPI001237A0E9|nr:hypothetical protein [Enterobacter bugandensis]
MTFKLEQSWKILISLDNNSPNYLNSHELFLIESGKSFLRKIGGGMENFEISPLVLRPTIIFNNAISKIANKLGFIGNKAPYKNGNKTLNITTHLYFEKYIILTLKHTQFDIPTTVNLREKTLLIHYPGIYKLALSIAGLIKSGDYKNIIPLTSIGTLRCTSIEISDGNSTHFDSSDLVESLTGHLRPVQHIVHDVLKRNKTHQLNEALTLIDKQGVIQQIPFAFPAKKEAHKKYVICCNLFELFILINKAVQDNAFGTNKTFIKAMTLLVKTPEKIVNSYTAIKTIEQFVKDFHLSNYLDDLEHEASKEFTLAESIKSQEIKMTSFKDGLKKFYASDNFFGVLLTALITGIAAAYGILVKFFE